MAGRKSSAYLFFAQSMETETNGGFASEELDESDVWGCTIEPRQAAESIRNKPIPSSRSNRKKSAANKGDRVTAAASLPVNIPDWSKILKDEYRGIQPDILWCVLTRHVVIRLFSTVLKGSFEAKIYNSGAPTAISKSFM